jgi:hypothetical protein
VVRTRQRRPESLDRETTTQTGTNAREQRDRCRALAGMQVKDRVVPIEEGDDHVRDLVLMGRGREVAGVEEGQLGLRQIVEVRAGALGREESVVPAHGSSAGARLARRYPYQLG